MLFRTLGANLLGNMLAGKVIVKEQIEPIKQNSN